VPGDTASPHRSALAGYAHVGTDYGTKQKQLTNYDMVASLMADRRWTRQGGSPLQRRRKGWLRLAYEHYAAHMHQAFGNPMVTDVTLWTLHGDLYWREGAESLFNNVMDNRKIREDYNAFIGEARVNRLSGRGAVFEMHPGTHHVSATCAECPSHCSACYPELAVYNQAQQQYWYLLTRGTEVSDATSDSE
jgi:hypothetical protein